MKVIVCLDDKGGMFFNNRRQSRDRVLNADVVSTVSGHRLLASPYSKMLFEGSDAALECRDDFLEIANNDDYCFVEDRALSRFAGAIDEIIIYRWNRRYPTDLFFDLDVSALGFEKVETTEFEGSSHEKITKETFKR